LSCVGSGLATGLIPRPRSHRNTVRFVVFRLILKWEQAKGPNLSQKEEEEEEEERS
jgi:hypothetical protein